MLRRFAFQFQLNDALNPIVAVIILYLMLNFQLRRFVIVHEVDEFHLRVLHVILIVVWHQMILNDLMIRRDDLLSRNNGLKNRYDHLRKKDFAIKKKKMAPNISCAIIR